MNRLSSSRYMMLAFELMIRSSACQSWRQISPATPESAATDADGYINFRESPYSSRLMRVARIHSGFATATCIKQGRKAHRWNPLGDVLRKFENRC
ncbi:hypothetical protein [Mesorhizobium captivum]|uniref:hypothetical protein n=1 Tax=Mesorhizobium captivum TaxID=3072319 RepID=UPI002A24E999|nr:hypothetical protein [Mesorhizobium sp. VK3C]MDX8450928.1 hypothetical protein [Mesorhizobium sp. VK3C]